MSPDFTPALSLDLGATPPGRPDHGQRPAETGDTAVHDVVIVGSGPAGYTAAIYTARADLNPIVLAGSVTAGGDLMNTTDVENYPGFTDGIMGPELMATMQAQAERFGADVRYEDAIKLELEGPIKEITVEGGEVLRARTVILATGSAYRELGLEDEKRLSGHGVSWCATCDGFFFKGQNIAVVGGGDSAIEEATFLTKFADKVTLIHRRDEFRASEIMQKRAFDDPKIEILWNKRVIGISGEAKVEELSLEDTVTGEVGALPVTGLFVAIGSDPRTHLFKDQVEITAEGTVAVDARSSRTSLPGVFAAGDVLDSTYRQAVTAAGSGCVAAIDVEHYLATVKA
ncbi:thioredoxin-disulfide reductase [Kocuria coralli]|uniref:Thioredoxin reductase n=1 Tax=Kocuria coralli TaxID=1461025 RepID=A0A5J5L150_9MICC|nr:thioredoxin-disulfide reductase [Kocuria coralli]KAA9394796.1 thioredoxin-disulfide reductase [Kocuria coralli]